MRAVAKSPRLRSPAVAGLTAFALAILAGFSARADPCKAIPDRGPTPAALAPGRVFSGAVVYVGDGDSLCIALGPGPANWVEVRLADVYAPELAEPRGREAKATLERIVSGRRLDCVAVAAATTGSSPPAGWRDAHYPPTCRRRGRRWVGAGAQTSDKNPASRRPAPSGRLRPGEGRGREEQ